MIDVQWTHLLCSKAKTNVEIHISVISYQNPYNNECYKVMMQ